MAVPEFKISLMKNCGSARVTHSDTRSYFRVQIANKSVCLLENVPLNVVKFVFRNVLSVSTNLNLSKWFNLFFKVQFWEIEYRRQMTDQEDTSNLCDCVSDVNIQQRKSWFRFGQICSRHSIVFWLELFVILLVIFCCFWKIHLSKTCDEETFWLGFLCEAAGYILLSPRLWTI